MADTGFTGGKKECFNKNKKIPVKPLVIEVNRYKDTFRLYYIFTNNKEMKMKETIAILLIYLGGFVAGTAFWVWLGTLLIWKIFEVAGAVGLIFPAFYIMVGGVIALIAGIIVGTHGE